LKTSTFTESKTPRFDPEPFRLPQSEIFNLKYPLPGAPFKPVVGLSGVVAFVSTSRPRRSGPYSFAVSPNLKSEIFNLKYPTVSPDLKSEIFNLKCPQYPR
jgi:hypothetical protein